MTPSLEPRSRSLLLWVAVLATTLLMLLAAGWPSIQLRSLESVGYVIWTAVLTGIVWLTITFPVRTITVEAAIWAFALGVCVVPIATALVALPFTLVFPEAVLSWSLIPILEELAKVTPIFFLAHLTRGRVFSGGTLGPVDFAILGLASGLGFELLEDMFHVEMNVQHLVFDESWGPLGLFPHTEFSYGWFGGPDVPFYLEGPTRLFNHGVTAGTVGLGFGLSIWMGDRAGKLRWLPAGVLLGLAIWEHMGFNLMGALGRDGPPNWMRFTYVFLTQTGRASLYVFAVGTLIAVGWEAWVIYGRRDPRWSLDWRKIGLRGRGRIVRRLATTAQIWIWYRRLRSAAAVGTFRRRGGTAERIDVGTSVLLSNMMKAAIEGTLLEEEGRTASSPASRIELPEGAAPLANGFVGDDDAPLGEKVLDVAETETESKVQPDGVGDDLAGEPIAAIGGQLTRHPFTLPTSGLS